MTANQETAPVDTIRQYVEDMSAVRQFLSYLPTSSAFPSVYTAPYFDWKTSRNPFGTSASFMRFRNGDPAAHCSITAKPGNPSVVGDALVGELGDTHTHPSFQRQGHFGALGKHTIGYFGEAAGAKESLIYGLPNPNAMPGWLRHCGCVIFEAMQIREVQRTQLRHIVASMAGLMRGSKDGVALERAGAVPDAEQKIDFIWTQVRADWLLSKTAAWWRWRYVDCTEHYSTYFFRRGTEIRGWFVVKQTPTRVPLIGRTAICDIVALTEDDEVTALDLILARVARPLDIVTMWVQRGTRVEGAAEAHRFETLRDVPVIFADNSAYRQMKSSGRTPRMSLGDTDNV